VFGFQTHIMLIIRVVAFVTYLKLLKLPIEDNKAWMTGSYLLITANYKTIKSVVCFDDSLIFV